MTTALQLRPYQVACVDAVSAAFAAGHRRVLVEKPTGCGKTVTFAECARRTLSRNTLARRRRVLVLAHRTELLDQARKKLLLAGCDAAIEQAGMRAGDADVVVASVQTLKGKRLHAWARDAFDLIIVDECHHAVAAGYKAILDWFSGAYVLGVTATADRLDGKGLGQVFQFCAFRYELRAAIRDGWLVPIVARRVELESVDLSDVGTTRGDLDQGELSDAMTEEAALHGVIIPLLRESSGRRTLGFAVGVKHAHELARVANEYEPGCARALDGDMSPEQRRAVLESFAAGEFRVLFNCEILTEGFDDPGISCIALCRPTKSRALLTQMVGRGTRLAPGKRDVLVLGMAPSTLGRHSLVGPADVLAGRVVEDEVRAELDRLLVAGACALDETLGRVEDDLARKREEHLATATARYVATEIDPFVGELTTADGALMNDVGKFLGARDRNAAEAGSAVTQAQRKVLAELGLEKLPDTLTAAEAGAWIGGLSRRRAMGFCSLKQARLLARAGYTNTKTMTFAEANRLVPQILANFSARRSMARTGEA